MVMLNVDSTIPQRKSGVKQNEVKRESPIACAGYLCLRNARRSTGRSWSARRNRWRTGCSLRSRRPCRIFGRKFCLAERTIQRSEIRRYDFLSALRTNKRLGTNIGWPKTHDFYPPYPLEFPHAQALDPCINSVRNIMVH